MRLRHLALTASLVLAVAACGGDDEDEAAAPAPAPETTSAAPAPTAPTTEGSSEDPAPSGEVTTLIGTLGEPDDPEAFEIGLTTEDGEPVTELPAGDYVITVDDQSRIHNWHLTGPGGVDVETGVSETEQARFEVTLEAGEYDYLCDPHPDSMNGSFTVT